MTLNLVQIAHPEKGRRVARVDGRTLIAFVSPASIYEMAMRATREKTSMSRFLERCTEEETLDYRRIYAGDSAWRLLPAFDHPVEPARCLVTGTGLTHRASAAARQQMHAVGPASSITDSARMYQWGLEAGRPQPGEIGVQPEWFYKGSGSILKAHGEVLEVAGYAEDGGEEAEVAAAYVVDDLGQAWRVGFMPGNEFSDHVMEKKNYLYLAPSKLRNCSIGPELVVGHDFDSLEGKVAIEREENTLWEKRVRTGEARMCHSLANLEHHHFKYAAHRVPGYAHIHFLGADALSFSDSVRLRSGDITEVAWKGLGLPLRNPVRIVEEPQPLLQVLVLQ